MLVVQSGGQQWGSGLEATRCQGSRVAPAADEPIEDKLHIRWTHWGRATLYQAYHLLSTVRQSSKSIRYEWREGCVYVYDCGNRNAVRWSQLSPRHLISSLPLAISTVRWTVIGLLCSCVTQCQPLEGRWLWYHLIRLQLFIQTAKSEAWMKVASVSVRGA